MTASVVLILLCIPPTLFCLTQSELWRLEDASDTVLILVGTDNVGKTAFEPPSSALLYPEFDCDTAWCNTFVTSLKKGMNTFFAHDVSMANAFGLKEDTAREDVNPVKGRISVSNWIYKALRQYIHLLILGFFLAIIVLFLNNKRAGARDGPTCNEDSRL